MLSFRILRWKTACFSYLFLDLCFLETHENGLTSWRYPTIKGHTLLSLLSDDHTITYSFPTVLTPSFSPETSVCDAAPRLSLPVFRLSQTSSAAPLRSVSTLRGMCVLPDITTLFIVTSRRGGREADVKRLGMVLVVGERETQTKPAEKALVVAAYLTGYEASQWLWHLAK